MVTLTVAVEEMKTQLVEVVRSSLENGFELVAGYAGTKIAKSVEGAVKNAEFVGKSGDIAGLREQIIDNAAILIPVMDHPPISGPRIPTCATLTLITDYDFAESIRVITVGNPSTGGTRALLYARTDDVRTKPRMILWSHKHELVTTALKELLDITQDHLKMHLSSHVYPPSPRASAAAADAARPKVPYPSFSAPSPTPSKASNAATAGGLTTVDDSDVPCWDNDYDNDSATKTKTHQNGDYNYRSSGTGYDPNGAAWSKLRRRS